MHRVKLQQLEANYLCKSLKIKTLVTHKSVVRLFSCLTDSSISDALKHCGRMLGHQSFVIGRFERKCIMNNNQ